MRRKAFFHHNYSESLALMYNYLFSHFSALFFRTCPALPKFFLSPNPSNHTRLLHHCLFVKFLPPSLEKLGRQNADIDELALRASVTVSTEADGWIWKYQPCMQGSEIQAPYLGSVACLSTCGKFLVWVWSAGTDGHMRTCSAEQSPAKPGANRLFHFYHWNYRMSWAQSLMMPVLLNVLYYGFTWRWLMVCSISCVFSLVFKVVLMLIITAVTQGIVEQL